MSQRLKCIIILVLSLQLKLLAETVCKSSISGLGEVSSIASALEKRFGVQKFTTYTNFKVAQLETNNSLVRQGSYNSVLKMAFELDRYYDKILKKSLVQLDLKTDPIESANDLANVADRDQFNSSLYLELKSFLQRRKINHLVFSYQEVRSWKQDSNGEWKPDELHAPIEKIILLPPGVNSVSERAYYIRTFRGKVYTFGSSLFSLSHFLEAMVSYHELLEENNNLNIK
ncbi:MAG: hypothetical protein ACK5V3_16975 [Bdellovibrionales bacterium]